MATTTRNRSRPVRESAPKPRNDAYTGLLFISFVALLTSSILLYLDYSQYGGKPPPKLVIPDLGKSPIPAIPAAPGPDAPSTPPPSDTPAAPPPTDTPAAPAAPGGPPGKGSATIPPPGPPMPGGPGGMPLPGAPGGGVPGPPK